MDDNQLKEYLAEEENDRKTGQKEIEAAYKNQYIMTGEDSYMLVNTVTVRGNYVTFRGVCIEAFDDYVHYIESAIEDTHVRNFDKNTGLSDQFVIIEKERYIKAYQQAIDILITAKNKIEND